MTKSLIYPMKYNFTKKSRRDMCCILGIRVIFSLDIPTRKLPLWHQGSTPWNKNLSDEGVGKTPSDCIELSGAGLLLSLTAIPSRRSVEISASITVIPQLTEESMGRGVSLSSLYLNLYNPSSVGTTAEYMEDSRVSIYKSKISSMETSSVICTILLVV